VIQSPAPGNVQEPGSHFRANERRSGPETVIRAREMILSSWRKATWRVCSTAPHAATASRQSRTCFLKVLRQAARNSARPWVSSTAQARGSPATRTSCTTTSSCGQPKGSLGQPSKLRGP
jgi:hypothetical protein